MTTMTSSYSSTDHRRGRTLVALAAVAWSTAGILQRELSVGIGTQLAGRALFAVLGMLAYVAVAESGAVARAFRSIGRGGVAVTLLLAISSRSEEHTSELQSRENLVCRLLLEKKKKGHGVKQVS